MANGAVYVIVMTALLAVVSLATRLSDLARIARKKAIMASETVKNAEKTTKEVRLSGGAMSAIARLHLHVRD